MKKLAALLLAMCIMISALPISAFAATASFTDVSWNAWYYEAVQYVCEHGIMAGAGQGKFLPNANMTRAQMCQLLYNMEGSPRTAGRSFKDVPASAWYYDAVSWASAQGIVAGTGNNRFSPDSALSREQCVTILYHYAQSKGYNTGNQASLQNYTDRAKVSSWALNAVKWAVGESLIQGVTKTTIAPGVTTTRSQAAALMMHFCQQHSATGWEPEKPQTSSLCLSDLIGKKYADADAMLRNSGVDRFDPPETYDRTTCWQYNGKYYIALTVQCISNSYGSYDFYYTFGSHFDEQLQYWGVTKDDVSIGFIYLNVSSNLISKDLPFSIAPGLRGNSGGGDFLNWTELYQLDHSMDFTANYNGIGISWMDNQDYYLWYIYLLGAENYMYGHCY